MSVKQISVFLENKPGKLSEMTELLAANNIDIRALSLAETKDFGIVRMIVDDVYEAVNVLKDGEFIAKLTHVLAYAVPDEPGGLNKLLAAFNAAKVNIEYMYAFLGGEDSKHAYMIFRVSDADASAAAVAANGYKALSQDDIAKL
ncbi:MAG: acetolactate synthase [Clostridia bacterium]|nr:acetolactate synthase [Clostridia bacterium]